MTETRDGESALRRERAKLRAYAPVFTERDPAHPVDVGPMFGAEGLRVGGKVFAFVAAVGALVVKVPADEVDRLVTQGLGQPMVMGTRRMREWAQIDGAWEGPLESAHRWAVERAMAA